jgi:ectoine hydroxylase-related dioxygenase (phytanoyl-CoA dioxygenase family)
VQLQHSKLAAKREQPGTGEVPWHQDFAFFPHSNTSLCAVMVMLDDATRENGCMQMVRGSHREGLRNHHDADGWFAGGCQDPAAWSDASRIVDVMPKAGGISIHHCLTMHSSIANRSGAPRRGVVFEYRAADAMQFSDEIWADTGLQVAGLPAVTVRCESATWQLSRRRREQPYGSAWHQRGALAS